MTEGFLFDLNVFYNNIDTLKQKQVGNIINLIRGGRIHEQIAFCAYGTMTFFDWDKQLRYPTINETDDFNRSKTNCLIYNIIDNKYKTQFNKLCIYYTSSKNESFYSVILYNTETGATKQRTLIDDDYGEIAIAITKIFHSMDLEPIYKYYVDKTDNIDMSCGGHNVKHKQANIEFYKQEKIKRYNELGLNIKVA